MLVRVQKYFPDKVGRAPGHVQTQPNPDSPWHAHNTRSRYILLTPNKIKSSLIHEISGRDQWLKYPAVFLMLLRPGRFSLEFYQAGPDRFGLKFSQDWQDRFGLNFCQSPAREHFSQTLYIFPDCFKIC